MLTTGTFSAPMLCSQLPPGKSILRPRIACHVEETSTPHQYDLYARTCADGSTQQEYIDFTDSIDSIHVLLNIAASSSLTISILDVSNAFQNSIIFDATERVYISLPPLFLEWFKHQWPDFPLPSQNPKEWFAVPWIMVFLFGPLMVLRPVISPSQLMTYYSYRKRGLLFSLFIENWRNCLTLLLVKGPF